MSESTNEMMNEPPPIPLQALTYSDPATEGVSTIVRAISIAGIMLGALHLVSSAAQLAPALINHGKNSVSFGLSLSIYPPSNLVLLCMELIGDASSIALIVGAAGLRSLRPWAVTAMIASLIAMSAAYVVAWICRMGLMFDSGALMKAWTGPVFAAYVLMTLAGVGHFLLLPALMLWLVTRPGMRRS